ARRQARALGLDVLLRRVVRDAEPALQRRNDLVDVDVLGFHADRRDLAAGEHHADGDARLADRHLGLDRAAGAGGRLVLELVLADERQLEVAERPGGPTFGRLDLDAEVLALDAAADRPALEVPLLDGELLDAGVDLLAVVADVELLASVDEAAEVGQIALDAEGGA